MKWKVNGKKFDVGNKVRCDVTWRDGRKSNVFGTLITIDSARKEAYIDTSFGAVAGDLDTLEHAL